MLAGRCSSSLDAWNARVALAEKLNIPVLTNIKVAAAFPTDHRLHAAPPGNRLSPEAKKLSPSADVILSLDWLDLGGTLKQAFGSASAPRRSFRFHATRIRIAAGAWTTTCCRRSTCICMCEPDAAVPLLLDAVQARAARRGSAEAEGSGRIGSRAHDRRRRRRARSGHVAALDRCITRLPLGWHGGYAHFRHPLDYIGFDGGGGVGAGPGITVGAALALKGSGRIAGRALRRRRFPDGQHRGLDRGALRHSVSLHRLQQPLVLQRRASPGTRRGRAQAPRREPLDRPAHRASPTSTSPRWRARKGATAFRSDHDAAGDARRDTARRRDRSRRAVCA